MERVSLPSLSLSSEHTTTCHRRHWWWWWGGAPPPGEELVFAMSYMMVTFILQLPMEYIDGNPVPTVIFHGHPTTFHVFVLGLCASFSGSIGTMELRKREPKLARYYRVVAVGAMAVTLAVFLWAAVPAGFCFLCSLMHAWLSSS
ncbi:hypothetical protein ACSBR2_010202 [Camellia fascicularis]